mmetsp:Transcript_19186/g.28124  ORF Transcript_19186/g.28124 Transcript_19186/m.28124 type:complete len:301 (-) Transcript_19186:448-1350(-)
MRIHPHALIVACLANEASAFVPFPAFKMRPTKLLMAEDFDPSIPHLEKMRAEFLQKVSDVERKIGEKQEAENAAKARAEAQARAQSDTLPPAQPIASPPVPVHELIKDAGFRSVYGDWCKEYGKEPSEYRFQTFSSNFKNARESGIQMRLDRYADLNPDERKKIEAETGIQATASSSVPVNELTQDVDFRSAYLDWCMAYGKKPNDYRFQTFSSNFENARESGEPMRLDKYSDYTKEEYTRPGDSSKKEESEKAKEEHAVSKKNVENAVEEATAISSTPLFMEKSSKATNNMPGMNWWEL